MMESRTEFRLSQNLDSVSRVMKPLPFGSQRANTCGVIMCGREREGEGRWESEGVGDEGSKRREGAGKKGKKDEFTISPAVHVYTHIQCTLT